MLLSLYVWSALMDTCCLLDTAHTVTFLLDRVELRSQLRCFSS